MSKAPLTNSAKNIFSLKPATKLDANTSFKLRITTNVKDQNGNKMESQYTSETGFTTTAAETVTTTDSAGGKCTLQKSLNSDGSVITFHKVIYGDNAKQTNDCGYIVAGNRKLTKLDKFGEIQWESEITLYQKKHSNLGKPTVIQTSDGGYLYSDNNGMAKVDSSGTSVWKNRKYRDYEDVIEHSNGYFYLVADDLKAHNSKAKVTKIDKNGKVKWRKGFGSTCQWEKFRSILETPDNELIIVGGRNHGNGTYKCSFEFYDDVWIIKVGAKGGGKLWEKFYGGNNFERAHDIVRHPKVGYTIIGTACNKKKPPKGGDYCSVNMSAYWMRIDDDGKRLSYKFITNGPNQRGFSITNTSSGGTAWVGENRKNVRSGRKTVTLYRAAFYKQFGKKVEFSKVVDLGGSPATSIELTPDGGFIIAAGKNVFKTDSDMKIPTLETICHRSDKKLCP